MDCKSKILAAGRIEEFSGIPEISPVYMKRMTGHERDIFISAQKPKEDTTAGDAGHLQRILLALTLCDSVGTRIFSADELKPVDSGIIDALCLEAFRINGFNKESQDEIEKKANAGIVSSGISSLSTSAVV